MKDEYKERNKRHCSAELGDLNSRISLLYSLRLPILNTISEGGGGGGGLHCVPCYLCE